MSSSCTNPKRQGEVLGEDTPLVELSRPLLSSLYRTRRRKCVTSKAALLILLWSFLVGVWGGMLLNPDLVVATIWHFDDVAITLGIYIGIALITCFFPLAGILADIKYGRYKTIITSICLVLLSLILLIPSISTLFLSKALSPIPFCLLMCISSIIIYLGLIGFNANAIQFGMDQLHDSPGEDRTLFIHWYVWTYYGSILVGHLTWYLVSIDYGGFIIDYGGVFARSGYSLLALVILFVIVMTILPMTLYLVRRRRRWFLIEPGQYNPYKLVYRVTKFARQHKIPLRRSAFTYCEDEVPMGLDLGKEKYGGPFTTEQVEDVKVFYGILKVLFSLGAAFFLDFAADSMLPLFTLHMEKRSSFLIEDRPPILINNGLATPLLIVISIPVYLCLLRPYLSKYVPGMLKRMGLGMTLVLLSLLATFSMDTVAHLKYPKDPTNPNSTTCFFVSGYSSIEFPFQMSNLIIIQLTVSAFARLLLYTGVFEFICSQSPHSMKGLLIGMFYAIRGLYQVLAALLVLPYNYWSVHMYPSCGFYFYLMNIVIGLVAVLVYAWVARRYRYRVRNELCNIHQYAEEYYSNPNQERFYGHDGK